MRPCLSPYSPEHIPKIEIVLMGGCLGTGNTGSVAEFNIQVLSVPLWLPFSSLVCSAVAGLRI